MAFWNVQLLLVHSLTALLASDIFHNSVFSPPCRETLYPLLIAPHFPLPLDCSPSHKQTLTYFQYL